MKQNNVLEKQDHGDCGFTETKALSESLWGSRGTSLALLHSAASQSRTGTLRLLQ